MSINNTNTDQKVPKAEDGVFTWSKTQRDLNKDDMKRKAANLHIGQNGNSECLESLLKNLL